nr:hypothetical protein [Bacteroidota bacterium]
MLKQLFFIFLFFLSAISFAQDLTVIQKYPETAIPGGDYVVETTVKRSGITGFMKFFQGVPSGCTAKVIESKGGSFSFDKGGAKIIWIALPAETEFTISYMVSIPKDIEGIKNINGKLSYMVNNERKVYDLETKTIRIGVNVIAAKTETVLVTGSDNTIITESPTLN